MNRRRATRRKGGVPSDGPGEGGGTPDAPSPPSSCSNTPSVETVEAMLAAVRRAENESAPDRTVFDKCPQIVLCDDCRTRAVLHSSPAEFPIRVTGVGIGCRRPIIWKKNASSGFAEDNVVIVCCETSLLFATGRPIRNVGDGTVKIARSWDTLVDA